MEDTKPPKKVKKAKAETGVVIKTDSYPDQNPMALIAIATQKGVDVATMEKLMDLQERWEKNQAKKAFNLAMAAFQGECPVIKKSTNGGTTNSGKVAYKYATLDSIVEQTKGLIQKNGFSYMIRTETMEAGVKVTCIVTHELGHSESTDVSVPLGTKTNVMSASQVVAAAITFAKRYAFSNAFGIMTGDEDNDAKKSPQEEHEDQTQKADDMFKVAQKMINDQTSVIELLNYQKKIESSTKYNEMQKAALLGLTEKRIDELQKKTTNDIPVIEEGQGTTGPY